MIGRVVSVKSLKTATVLEERLVKHPLYKKTYKQSKKYLVDDSIGVKVGDIVNYVSCKPISKNKHWKITKVLGTNFAEIAEVELKKEAEDIISEVMPEEKKEDRVQGVGSSEEIKETEKAEGKKKRVRKEKLAPKP